MLIARGRGLRRARGPAPARGRRRVDESSGHAGRPSRCPARCGFVWDGAESVLMYFDAGRARAQRRGQPARDAQLRRRRARRRHRGPLRPWSRLIDEGAPPADRADAYRAECDDHIARIEQEPRSRSPPATACPSASSLARLRGHLARPCRRPGRRPGPRGAPARGPCSRRAPRPPRPRPAARRARAPRPPHGAAPPRSPACAARAAARLRARARAARARGAACRRRGTPAAPRRARRSRTTRPARARRRAPRARRRTDGRGARRTASRPHARQVPSQSSPGAGPQPTACTTASSSAAHPSSSAAEATAASWSAARTSSTAWSAQAPEQSSCMPIAPQATHRQSSTRPGPRDAASRETGMWIS